MPLNFLSVCKPYITLRTREDASWTQKAAFSKLESRWLLSRRIDAFLHGPLSSRDATPFVGWLETRLKSRFRGQVSEETEMERASGGRTCARPRVHGSARVGRACARSDIDGWMDGRGCVARPRHTPHTTHPTHTHTGIHNLRSRSPHWLARL